MRGSKLLLTLPPLFKKPPLISTSLSANFSTNSSTPSSVDKIKGLIRQQAPKAEFYLRGYDPEIAKPFLRRLPNVEPINFEKKNATTDGAPIRTVICTSGNGAVAQIAFDGGLEDFRKNTPQMEYEEGLKDISGFPKRIIALMGGKDILKTTQFISIGYPSVGSTRYGLIRSNLSPDTYISGAALSMAHAMLPLIAQKGYTINIDGSVTGQRKPIEDVMEAVDRVTLVAQSYGGSFMRQMCNALRSLMRNLRYNEKEIPNIFERLVFIGFGPVTNALTDNRTPLNSVYFVNAADKRAEKRVKRFTEITPKELKDNLLVITGLNHNTSAVWGSLSNHFTFTRQCDGKQQKVNDPEGHDIAVYTAENRILPDGSIAKENEPFV